MMHSEARGAKPALARLHELAVRHGTDLERERLNRITAGVAPGAYHRPLEHGHYLSESSAVLFERLFKEVSELREMISAVMFQPSSGLAGRNNKGRREAGSSKPKGDCTP